jgi:isocitrate dehydrogenase
MMKVSDPVMFGHVVSVFFKDLFEKYGDTLKEIGFDPNNGLGDLMNRLQSLPDDQRAAIEAEVKACMDAGPDLYMVNSERGITNLHVPSDVIVDASMPALIRAGGKGWGPDGKQHDTKCVIPDYCYAPIYRETIDFCKEHGAFDPSTMGTVSNVGLMADKAEEYGSHLQTFVAPGNGAIRVVDAAGGEIHEQNVEEGDIWRLCMAESEPTRDWVKLAVVRARATGDPAIFWLNPKRAHHAEQIRLVAKYLKEHDTEGLDVRIMNLREASQFTLDRMKRGLNTISVTGNVLRDYLTDLFPILEVGTSAKMLSIVPLLAGGGLFETGAGGSAPMLYRQLIEDGHFCWDSLGEFCALGASLEHLAGVTGNAKATVLAKTLDQATEKVLDTGKSPGPNLDGTDTRSSHFYLALYWAEALAEQDQDAELKAIFEPITMALRENETKILKELGTVHGKSSDLGGYYYPDTEKLAAVMRPSKTFNAIIDR